MEKFTGTVKLVGDYTFSSNYGRFYSYNIVHIYRFADKYNNVYVWKTGNVLYKEDMNGDEIITTYINKGDIINIKASIKGESDYKGEHQTVLTRVTVTNIVEKALTKEEKEEIRKNEQLNSLGDNDFIWEMPYKQFKEHYSDCETLAGSFISGEYGGPALITVIIREGRLKNSGVRGKHFYGFKLEDEDGRWYVFRAVSEENAIRQAKRLYPSNEWTCTEVYDYRY